MSWVPKLPETRKIKKSLHIKVKLL